MDYKERMVEEVIALEQKLDKLEKYLKTESIKTLHWLDVDLIERQFTVMLEYNTILNARIGRL